MNGASGCPCDTLYYISGDAGTRLLTIYMQGCSLYVPCALIRQFKACWLDGTLVSMKHAPSACSSTCHTSMQFFY